MHIVQALVSLNLGGSELVAVELSEHLQENGHRCTVIAADGPLGDRVRSSGAQHLDWPIGKKRLSTLRLIRRLADWVEKEQPDAVHVHSRLPAWICLLALRRLPESRRPVLITTVHGHYSVNRYSAVMTRGEKVIAVSDAIRQYTLKNYPGVDAERLITVHGGISRRLFPYGFKPEQEWLDQARQDFPELEGKRILCLPGRLSRYKGHVDFIELLAQVSEEQDDIHGIIVGKAKPGSRYRDELEGLVERYGISDRLTFTGARTDMREWLSISEVVYSLCSDPPEAFGRTVPEALFLGTPVIGWDHGGVHETLAKLFPGGAVKPDDSQALFQRTLEFLQQPPVVPEGTAFGLEESMKKTTAVYKESLAVSSSRTGESS